MERAQASRESILHVPVSAPAIALSTPHPILLGWSVWAELRGIRDVLQVVLQTNHITDSVTLSFLNLIEVDFTVLTWGHFGTQRTHGAKKSVVIWEGD